MRWNLSREALAKHSIAYVTAFTAAISIALGGATRSGSLGDVILQLFAIILLLMALRGIVHSGVAKQFKAPLIFVAAVVLVPMIQLVPLTSAVWHLLPQRSVISDAYMLIDEPLPSLPITLTPAATWLGLAALLPPIAIFLGTLTLDTANRRVLVLIIIAMGLASVFLGLLQLAQGPNSPLRFYDITNRSEAVGFFANRNHFAALLYVSILFIAAHLGEAVIGAGQGQTRRRGRIDINSISPIVVWATMLVVILAGDMMARSRAGLVLSGLALLASLFLSMGDPRTKVLRSGFMKVIAGSVLAVLLFLAPLAIYRVADRLGADADANVRVAFARTTIAAAMDFMPFGSGVGSFVPVYQLYEKTPDIGTAFANHAHNDLIEVWLESGILGVGLMVFFGVWLLLRVTSLWNGTHAGEGGLDLSLQRAASTTLILLAIHSLVDYPLRTTGMMAVAAVAAGCLMPCVTRPSERQPL